MIRLKNGTIIVNFSFMDSLTKPVSDFLKKNIKNILLALLVAISVAYFISYYFNGLGLSYNDARSHLDIGRRVVEGLKPGVAQLGSVWLPLPHVLMLLTVWNDFMWHSGLSGALQSMFSFVATALLIYAFLKELNVGMLGRLVGVFIFVANLNILYLQSTAMTELLLIATMTASAYELLLWFKKDTLFNLVKASFWIMLSTLIRYDGWFLFVFAGFLISTYVIFKKGYKQAEGTAVLYGTLAGFGVILWLVWNQLIFHDALYFIFGPYSAHAQQDQLANAGILATKGNVLFSIKVYLYALAYNSNMFIAVLGVIGAIVFWIDKNISRPIKIASLSLLAPLIFNILALYLGHSVLFVQGLSGDTWFNVRYGIVMMPGIAIFIGYLIHKLPTLRNVLIGLILFVTFFSFTSRDAVTIDDARVGSSQKNVSEVSGWLTKYAKNEQGFILISVASHDAIIFSSGLPMKRFIHEGTGIYWDTAAASPELWARWIVMRTNDMNDSTFKLISKTPAYKNGMYKLVDHYPFADIYELKPEYLQYLNVNPTLKQVK